MQAGGQYGPSDVQQFRVGRGAMFSHVPGADQIMQQHLEQAAHQIGTHQTQGLQQSQIIGNLQAQNLQQSHELLQQQVQLQKESCSALDSSRAPSGSLKQLVVARESIVDDDDMEEDEKGSAANRWPKQETLALIKIRTDMDACFKESALKGPLWQEISGTLATLGYHRSAKKCKEKFENIYKYYKKTKECRAGRQHGKSYRFFSELEALYGGNSVNDSGWGAKSDVNGSRTGGRLESAALQNEEVKRTLMTLSTDRAGLETGPRKPTPAGVCEEIHISSDFSDGDSDEPGDVNQSEPRNKKRKPWLSQMLYFETVLTKLMDKQEAMQKKLLEAIELREQERLMREEAWKRQEVARMNRELELRAQERSLAAARDAALVTLLQKVTGQTLEFPPILDPPPTAAAAVSKPGEISTSNQAQQEEVTEANSNRWPKPEVLALIRLRSSMETKFQEPGSKSALWEDIAAEMSRLGYPRNAKRCKEKWENINKYFRRTKESNKKRSEDSKTCPYYHQLDTLYSTGVLSSTHINKPLKLEDKAAENSDLPHEPVKDENSHTQALTTRLVSSDDGRPPDEQNV